MALYVHEASSLPTIKAMTEFGIEYLGGNTVGIPVGLYRQQFGHDPRRCDSAVARLNIEDLLAQM